MKTSILKSVVLMMMVVGFVNVAQAQNRKDCNNVEPQAQKACFEQLVAFNLSELIEYPEEATFEDVEGKVYVRFTTNEFNDIENIRILGKANEELAGAVVKAVQKLNQNNYKDMIASNSVYRIPINFELE